MIVPFTSINPDIVKKAKEKYKGWSREKFLEAAIAALYPEHLCGKGTLQVTFMRVVEIDEGGLSRLEFAASLVEIKSRFFSVLVHEFTLEESRVIKAQKIYWEMVHKLEAVKDKARE